MEITTERLILREFVAEDWRALMEYQRDPRYGRYYDGDPGSEAHARELVGWFLDYQRTVPRTKFQLAITLKSSGALIGNCGIRTTDAAAREADMGCALAPDHWGRGYATEALREMLRFGFEEMNLHRIWTSSIAENTAAARLVESLGFTREATFRRKAWMQGRWWDVAVHAMLDDEYRRFGG